MSEEEKKAIEILSIKATTSSIEAISYPNAIVMKKDIKTVLNLIDKQQKEIEEFRGIKNGTTIIYKGKAKYVREDKINKYYISKDKIRKIKELINKRNSGTGYTSLECIEDIEKLLNN